VAIPVFITCRDRLEPLLGLLHYLERAGWEDVYLLDNASTYPPLLEYYERTPHRLIRFEHNFGHQVFWRMNMFERENVTGKFVVTDCDIVPIEECPLDAIDYFAEVLDFYHDIFKVGFGFKLDDIPDTYKFKHEMIPWEARFQRWPLGPRLYKATLGTHFCVYRPNSGFARAPSIRTGYPYMARHTSWYVNSGDLTDEDAFYRESVPAANRQWEDDKLPFRVTEWLERRKERQAARKAREAEES
jgi:hypothetical protein